MREPGVKYCPKYTEHERSTSVTQEQDEKTVNVTETTYDSLICDESCALYEFRPNCIKEGGS